MPHDSDGPPLLRSLAIGDPAEVWAGLGFAVVDGTTVVDGVVHRLGSAGPALHAWAFSGLSFPAGEFEGLPTGEVPASEDVAPSPSHPNGVVGLDHIVLFTPNHARTCGALEEAGLPLRRIREVPKSTMVQGFFRLGPVILEVVGDAAKEEDGPSRLFGLTYTVADLDATAAFLGDRLRPAKDAVQPGRRIATLDRDAGSAIPIAFMTPDHRVGRP